MNEIEKLETDLKRLRDQRAAHDPQALDADWKRKVAALKAAQVEAAISPTRENVATATAKQKEAEEAGDEVMSRSEHLAVLDAAIAKVADDLDKAKSAAANARQEANRTSIANLVSLNRGTWVTLISNLVVQASMEGRSFWPQDIVPTIDAIVGGGLNRVIADAHARADRIRSGAEEVQAP